MKNKNLSIRLSEADLEKFNSIAERFGLTQGQVIRVALRGFDLMQGAFGMFKKTFQSIVDDIKKEGA